MIRRLGILFRISLRFMYFMITLAENLGTLLFFYSETLFSLIKEFHISIHMKKCNWPKDWKIDRDPKILSPSS